MNIKLNKIKKIKKSYQITACIGVILFSVIVFIAFKNHEDKQAQEGPPNTIIKVEPVKAGSGGDLNLVNNYHKQAVAAWKAGDKDKAKELAKKGLEANEQLSSEQLQKQPNHTEIVYDMYDMTQDVYHAEP